MSTSHASVFNAFHRDQCDKDAKVISALESLHATDGRWRSSSLLFRGVPFDTAAIMGDNLLLDDVRTYLANIGKEKDAISIAVLVRCP